MIGWRGFFHLLNDQYIYKSNRLNSSPQSQRQNRVEKILHLGVVPKIFRDALKIARIIL